MARKTNNDPRQGRLFEAGAGHERSRWAFTWRDGAGQRFLEVCENLTECYRKRDELRGSYAYAAILTYPRGRVFREFDGDLF